jgi:hypothetical protein
VLNRSLNALSNARLQPDDWMITDPLPIRARISLDWALGCFLLPALALNAADWPQYRGPNHDGMSMDPIKHNWSGSMTNPVWLVPVRNGLCSFAVSGGRAFSQIRRNLNGADKEVCVALSTTNGDELWATIVDNNTYYDGGVGYDDGPRTTPSAAGDSVYVLSSYLNLWRLNATNGAVIWGTNLLAGYGGSMIGWQNAASPLIDNGLIFLNANCGNNTIMALRTTDASPAWRSMDVGMTHSTPVLATIHDVRQLIFASQNGLVSLNPQTGALLWRFPYPFSYAISLAVSPVVYDDMVFVCGAHGYGMGSVVMQANFTNSTWTTAQLWSTNDPASHWMTPVAYQGFLYGQFGIQFYDYSTATQLKCINMRTGSVMWSTNDFGHGGTLLVDGHLLVLTEIGELVLAEANTNAYTELGRFLAITNYSGDYNKCWNSPAVADGRVYVRSTSYGACFDLSMPILKVDSPQFVAGNRLQLTIRSADGSPISADRLPNIEVRTSTNSALPRSVWTKLTNDMSLIDGVIRVTDIDATAYPRSFYVITESN